ncbi:MAG TPA: GspH/FimT family pseudopilin [Woeseiaceae bacterium]|nr:GspH/FimT family pseudopilin [Woeseiaceae bacterium]
MSPKRGARGYTLYELVMTLAIAALVLTLGLPSFGGLVADKRLRAETDALFHALHLARKASIVRRREVSLCPSSDGLSCDGGTDWSAGWILFVNADRDGPPRVDGGEPILVRRRVHERVRIASNRQAFTMRTTHLRATNGTLVVCDRAERAESRAVIVSYTGRPRVARRDRRGDAYACTD